MNENKNKCNKCSQTKTYPYYDLTFGRWGESKKAFCLECWKQEEKNYRKMSEESFNDKTSELNVIKNISGTNGNIGNFEIAVIHWDGERKKWVWGKGKKDEDKDVNPFIDTSGNNPSERERERERESKIGTIEIRDTAIREYC